MCLLIFRGARLEFQNQQRGQDKKYLLLRIEIIIKNQLSLPSQWIDMYCCVESFAILNVRIVSASPNSQHVCMCACVCASVMFVCVHVRYLGYLFGFGHKLPIKYFSHLYFYGTKFWCSIIIKAKWMMNDYPDQNVIEYTFICI